MNQLTTEQQALLILLRQSLWGKSIPLPPDINWDTVDQIAREQAVTTLLYGGALNYKEDIPPELLAKWKKQLLFGVMNNEKLLCAQDELLAWFDKANIPSAILKGSSVARYYPQPEARRLGNIDILVSPEDNVRTLFSADAENSAKLFRRSETCCVLQQVFNYYLSLLRPSGFP